MSANILNFEVARANKLRLTSLSPKSQIRQSTVIFARILNETVSQHTIDPVHQATLLMAKAVDIIGVAGPVTCSLQEQHARASNLLQFVFRARNDMLEKSVRIVSAENISSHKWEKDEFII
jgi:hypothetical protein